MSVRWRDDRGSGTLELQGVLAVAAVLIVAVVGAVAVFPSEASTAVCRVVAAFDGGGACLPGTSASEPLTDEQLKPEVCKLSQTSSSGGGGVEIAIVKLGGDWSVSYSQMSNGEVHATVTNGASAGAQLKAGAEIGPAATAEVSVSGGYTYQLGDTWVYGKEEWPAAKAQMEKYAGQAWLRWAGAGDWWGARPPGPADIRYHEFGAEARVDATAQVGGKLPAQPDGPTPTLELANISAGAGGRVSAQRSDNSKEEKVTWTYSVAGDASASAGVVGMGVSGEVAGTGSLGITRTYDGTLVEVTFETVTQTAGSVDVAPNISYTASNGPGNKELGSTAGGGASATDRTITVTTTTLEVTRENRDLVEAYLSSGRVLPAVVPVVPDSPSDDAWLQHLYERATTSRNVYAASAFEKEMGASVSVGVGFGVNGSSGEANETIDTSQFLGSPRTDGKRPFLADADCTV